MRRTVTIRRGRYCVALLASLAVLVAASGAATAAPVPWNTGDVFAAVGNGSYNVYDNAGNFKQTIVGPSSTYTTGCAFNTTRTTLYTTNIYSGQVVKFDDADPHTASAFNTGYYPESVAFGPDGGYFVGGPLSTAVGHWNASDGFVTTYFPAGGDGTGGTDWIDVAANGTTLYYDGEGTKIKRYDTVAGQLADFATLPGSDAFALRLLPPFDGSGGMLVADTQYVLRLDAGGNIVQTYTTTGVGQLFSLNLDPDGTTFWTGDSTTGILYRFNIATGGAPVQTLNTGVGSNRLYGVCVKGEITGAGGSGDQSPPVSSVTYDRAPDSCCWYISAVKPTVSATDPDGDSDVAETRCQLDGTPPATFDDLPATPCPYLAPSQYVFTEGIHKLYVASKDKAGNKEIPKTFTFKIDLQGPTSQIDPLAPFQTTNPFTVSWSGSDTVSGVKDYDVRYRQASGSGPFGPYVQWFTQTTSTSASFSAPPGTTTCFSVRARDNACWTTVKYSPEQCTTAPYDDPSLTRFGYWSTVTGSGYYGPSVSRSTTMGDKLSLSLTGSVIGVLATKQPGGGTVQLRWNGVTMSTQSLSSATVMKKQLLTFNLSGVQTGTLEIVHSGAGTVDIDAAGAYRAS